MLLISEDNAKEDRNAIETFKECLKDEVLLETLIQASTTYNCEQYSLCNNVLGRGHNWTQSLGKTNSNESCLHGYLEMLSTCMFLQMLCVMNAFDFRG